MALNIRGGFAVLGGLKQFLSTSQSNAWPTASRFRWPRLIDRMIVELLDYTDQPAASYKLQVVCCMQ